jgi:hypothetical protein
MVEVYVFMEGGRPKEVVLGRRHAVDRLLQNSYRTTEGERKAISLFLERAMPDIGEGIRLVGWILDFSEKVPDREIVRVLGPGSLV